MRVLDIAGPDEHSQTVIGTSRGSPSELDIALSEGVTACCDEDGPHGIMER